MSGAWIKELPVAITVCDQRGTILEMNDRAGEVFAGSGGTALVGRNVLDCHPQAAREKLRQLLDGGASTLYTLEKGGRRKLIVQLPWTTDGVRQGLVELSLELPPELPHFRRD
jgi:PAS domain-containing protein